MFFAIGFGSLVVLLLLFGYLAELIFGINSKEEEEMSDEEFFELNTKNITDQLKE